MFNWKIYWQDYACSVYFFWGGGEGRDEKWWRMIDFLGRDMYYKKGFILRLDVKFDILEFLFIF